MTDKDLFEAVATTVWFDDMDDSVNCPYCHRYQYDDGDPTSGEDIEHDEKCPVLYARKRLKELLNE